MVNDMIRERLYVQISYSSTLHNVQPQHQDKSRGEQNSGINKVKKTLKPLAPTRPSYKQKPAFFPNLGEPVKGVSIEEPIKKLQTQN